ncbi:hypothetical protein E5D57_009079 [Metarhizium anisopliae]|nr:hypothetical protein E5D57_009079 [Metarhizium anisopliae]
MTVVLMMAVSERELRAADAEKRFLKETLQEKAKRASLGYPAKSRLTGIFASHSRVVNPDDHSDRGEQRDHVTRLHEGYDHEA